MNGLGLPEFEEGHLLFEIAKPVGVAFSDECVDDAVYGGVAAVSVL